MAPNCSGVSARITANSSAAKAATAVASTEKARFARAARYFHQTTNWMNASVRHAPTPTDQMTVTQLITSLLPVYTAAMVSGEALIFRSSNRRLSKQRFALRLQNWYAPVCPNVDDRRSVTEDRLFRFPA